MSRGSAKFEQMNGFSVDIREDIPDYSRKKDVDLDLAKEIEPIRPINSKGISSKGINELADSMVVKGTIEDALNKVYEEGKKVYRSGKTPPFGGRNLSYMNKLKEGNPDFKIIRNVKKVKPGTGILGRIVRTIKKSNGKIIEKGFLPKPNMNPARDMLRRNKEIMNKPTQPQEKRSGGLKTPSVNMGIGPNKPVMPTGAREKKVKEIGVDITTKAHIFKPNMSGKFRPRGIIKDSIKKAKRD